MLRRFVVNDLQTVDRTVTPWVIVVGLLPLPDNSASSCRAKAQHLIIRQYAAACPDLLTVMNGASRPCKPAVQESALCQGQYWLPHMATEQLFRIS